MQFICKTLPQVTTQLPLHVTLSSLIEITEAGSTTFSAAVLYITLQVVRWRCGRASHVRMKDSWLGTAVHRPGCNKKCFEVYCTRWNLLISICSLAEFLVLKTVGKIKCKNATRIQNLENVFVSTSETIQPDSKTIFPKLFFIQVCNIYEIFRQLLTR